MDCLKLFALGEAFDVDAYLASTALVPGRISRRGEFKAPCGGVGRFVSSGVQFELGNGTLPPWEQEGVAISFLKAHREELVALAKFPGVSTFTLGLQYQQVFKANVAGFVLSTSPRLLWHVLDVGCQLNWYVTLERETPLFK